MAAVAARNVLQAPKSAAHKKYENYKVATSLAEARRLGADTRSLTWDLQRGFLTLLSGPCKVKSEQVDGKAALVPHTPVAARVKAEPADQDAIPVTDCSEAPRPMEQQLSDHSGDALQALQTEDMPVVALPASKRRGVLKRRRVQRQASMRRKLQKTSECRNCLSHPDDVRRLLYAVCLSDKKLPCLRESMRLHTLATAITFLEEISSQRTAARYQARILAFALLENAFGLEGNRDLVSQALQEMRVALKVSAEDRTDICVAKMIICNALYSER